MFVLQTGFGWKRRTPTVKTATFPEKKLCNLWTKSTPTSKHCYSSVQVVISENNLFLIKNKSQLIINILLLFKEVNYFDAGRSYLKTLIKTNIYKNGILNILVEFYISEFRV